MRLTQVVRIFTSQTIQNSRGIKLTNYHNRGKPKRVLRDDGSNYYDDQNITKKEDYYRQQLNRLDDLERMQLNISPNSKSKKSNGRDPSHRSSG